MKGRPSTGFFNGMMFGMFLPIIIPLCLIGLAGPDVSETTESFNGGAVAGLLTTIALVVGIVVLFKCV